MSQYEVMNMCDPEHMKTTNTHVSSLSNKHQTMSRSRQNLRLEDQSLYQTGSINDNKIVVTSVSPHAVKVAETSPNRSPLDSCPSTIKPNSNVSNPIIQNIQIELRLSQNDLNDSTPNANKNNSAQKSNFKSKVSAGSYKSQGSS